PRCNSPPPLGSSDASGDNSQQFAQDFPPLGKKQSRPVHIQFYPPDRSRFFSRPPQICLWLSSERVSHRLPPKSWWSDSCSGYKWEQLFHPAWIQSFPLP